MIILDTPIKFLQEDGRATHSKKKSYPINRWLRVKGPLKMCENGYHYTTPRYWREWLTTRVHLVQPSEERLVGDNKFCARGIKLSPRLETWTPRMAALFAADCAERVLPVFERACPGDGRPRLAIQAARTGGAPEAARAAAGAAGAAGAARAVDVAGAAGAAGAADVAWAAARAADAAWAAADAAGAAARAAARAARAAEAEWQDARFLQYLNGEVQIP